MKSRIDLHLHSTASDGTLTPTQLVDRALDKGLEVIALTDHDTTDGIEEALEAARGTSLTVIPGVEVSTDVPGTNELHILGYYIDVRHAELEASLSTLRRARVGRARRTLACLEKAGCSLEWDHLVELSQGEVIGRPHIAQALVDAGHVATVHDAFRRYLAKGRPAYVERYRLTPTQAIQTILAAGGVPVLAHPGRVLEEIPRLVRAGLAGLEAYYPTHPAPEQVFLRKLAKKHNLLVTGGTDFHGPGITEASDLGVVYVPRSAVTALAEHARNKRRQRSTLAAEPAR
jgi:predicted metal-dependent phosphoesterase TrpH